MRFLQVFLRHGVVPADLVAFQPPRGHITHSTYNGSGFHSGKTRHQVFAPDKARHKS